MLQDATHRQNLQLIEPREFKHHNQEELREFLQLYSDQYPHITRLYDIGQSVQGRTLWVFEISDNPGIHEPGGYIHLKIMLKGSQWYGKNVMLSTGIRNSGKA